MVMYKYVHNQVKCCNNALGPIRNDHHVAGDTFKWILLIENIRILFKSSWILNPTVHCKIFQHWFRKWLGAEQATNRYLKQWWLSVLSHICVNRPRCVNELFVRINEVHHHAIHQSDKLYTLLWRQNDRGGVSDHQPYDCLLSRLFKRRSKKTSKLRVTGLCVGNSRTNGQ